MNKKPYSDLQDAIDNSIGNIGVEGTTQLIKSFTEKINKEEIEKIYTTKQKTLDFIFNKCTEGLKISETDFYYKKRKEYCTDARSIYTYLVTKYVNASILSVSKKLLLNRTTIRYYIMNTKSMLDKPNLYPFFINKLLNIENKLQLYIKEL